jgi:hypothetical protein
MEPLLRNRVVEIGSFLGEDEDFETELPVSSTIGAKPMNAQTPA